MVTDNPILPRMVPSPSKPCSTCQKEKCQRTDAHTISKGQCPKGCHGHPTNPERSEGKGTEKCDGPGYPNRHTSPAVWCTCKDYAPAKLEWEDRFDQMFVSYHGKVYQTAGVPREIKSFIRQLLLQARKAEQEAHGGLSEICRKNHGPEALRQARREAIESCVKAVETASKVPCENCSHMFCISKRLSLSALRRLLREESEDKKDE